MNYLTLLKESYEQEKIWEDDITPSEFLADHIFDLTTYDSAQAIRMSKDVLSVCLAITDRNTFKYIENEDNYENYLNCINLVFFMDKLEWGTSIRGAWWDLYGGKTFEIDSCGLHHNGGQLLNIKFNEKEWTEFIYAMRDFVQEFEDV